MTCPRMLFLTFAVIILIGIWLTGFSIVHWFLYIPVILLVFAGVTGKCPGLCSGKKMGFKD